jgi:hypothetical protein
LQRFPERAAWPGRNGFLTPKDVGKAWRDQDQQQRHADGRGRNHRVRPCPAWLPKLGAVEVAACSWSAPASRRHPDRVSGCAPTRGCAARWCERAPASKPEQANTTMMPATDRPLPPVPPAGHPPPSASATARTKDIPQESPRRVTATIGPQTHRESKSVTSRAVCDVGSGCDLQAVRVPRRQPARLEQSCPRLSERGHGTWYFHCSATNLLGRRERARRGGYPSQAAARQARNEFLAGSAADRTAEGWTVERWLRHWLDSRASIRPTTRFHYTRDVDTVLIPYLGRYRLADLDAQLRVHPIRRAADQPEPRHLSVPDPRAARRAAPGPAARPAARRRVPRA